MDYGQARAFLDEIAKNGSSYGLDGIRNLMGRLGNVQEQLRVIHIAGTNGKGSVCAMLAGILREAGYRTGVYASPAVFSPEEIIKVDGVQISREDFAEIVSDVRAACAGMQKDGLAHPSAFEVETAAAFCFFQRKNCDYVVLEAGLGGASDATNVVTRPVCSVITSIGRDHMALLGETPAEIAAAKAGIFKPGCPCVASEQEPEALAVLQKAADAVGSTLWVADNAQIKNFAYDGQKSCFEIEMATDMCAGGLGMAGSGWRVFRDNFGKRHVVVRSALTGAFQRDNMACVLAVINVLCAGGIRIAPQAVAAGIASARLPGRFERIRERTDDVPAFYIDGAHNESAAIRLKETVQNCFAGRRMVFLLGVLADKEYDKMLEIMLPLADTVVTVTPHNPRALDGRKLAQAAKRYHSKAVFVPELAQAVDCAAKAAGRDGVALAFGSFSYLGELRQAVMNKNG